MDWSPRIPYFLDQPQALVHRQAKNVGSPDFLTHVPT